MHHTSGNTKVKTELTWGLEYSAAKICMCFACVLVLCHVCLLNDFKGVVGYGVASMWSLGRGDRDYRGRATQRYI